MSNLKTHIPTKDEEFWQNSRKTYYGRKAIMLILVHKSDCCVSFHKEI